MSCPYSSYVESDGSEDNSNKVVAVDYSLMCPPPSPENHLEESDHREDSDTGKSVSLSMRSAHSSKYETSSEDLAMPSSHEVKPRQRTSGKTPPAWDSGLSSEQNPFVETPRLTGSPCGTQLSLETSMQSLQTFVWSVTGPYVPLLRIMTVLNRWNALSMFSGVLLALESPGEPGKKQDWELIVRTRDPNSGVDTPLRKMLLSMSFEEVLTSATSCAGLIVTRFAWKSKGRRDLCVQEEFGSPPTWTPVIGTPMSTT